MSPPASSKPLTTKTFDGLQGDFCKDEILVRLIHFWEARNFRQGNALMGVELVLIDTNATRIQGFISANRLFRYKDKLKRNSIYKLSKFVSNPSKKLYRVASHKYSISFTDQTLFVEENAENSERHTQQFRLRHFEDLASMVDKHTDL
ncbi:unnamed protein product [Thlaspi arvense]|uniref:Replication protein A 70 kDa DNA-binding subunit B/D first OB fold domain-containing protein n=1 Tax=Thlaspi arvense TaxID=13288 RepID=A0AAU9RVQ3_THLAR|nr:unnamed protein product [Thlaspi arvense]